MDRPRALVVLCLLLLAGLSWLAEARTPPRIAPADAPLWEGQTITVAGWASQVKRDPDGSQRMALRQGSHAVEASASVADVQDGDWAEVTGRVARLSGRLVVLAEWLAVTRGPGPAEPTWAQLAHDPESWSHQPLRLSGVVEGELLQGDGGRQVRLGRGPWPAEGPATLTGILAYDSGCLCHALSASGGAWTP